MEQSIAPSCAAFAKQRQLREVSMLLPAKYFWFEPVLLAAIVVFFIDLIGNFLSFGNRVVNALTTAIVFAAVFGGLVYFGYGNVSVSVTTSPRLTAPANSR